MVSTVRYVVIVEQGESGFGAYVPDLPGCVAVGETRDEAMRLVQGPSGCTWRACAKRAFRSPSPRPAASTWMLGPYEVCVHGNDCTSVKERLP